MKEQIALLFARTVCGFIVLVTACALIFKLLKLGDVSEGLVTETIKLVYFIAGAVGGLLGAVAIKPNETPK